MEMASLKRFAFIRLARESQDGKRSLLFFTPTEELHGGNIFSKVSHKYNVIQPYLDMIDGEFIQLMNHNVQNIALYVNPNYLIVNNLKVSLDSL